MTPGWPAGAGRYSHDELVKALWDAASSHAHHAYELYPEEDSFSAQKMAISIGAASELLIKCVLANRSFHLLADKFTPETALTLDGKGTLKDHLPQMLTVVGVSAFNRLNKLHSLKLNPADFELVFTARNTAVHMGLSAKGANEKAFKQMVLLTDALLPELADARLGGPDEYWGSAAAVAFVRNIVDDAATEAQLAYDLLLQRARTTFQTLSAGLLESERANVIAQFARIRPEHTPGTETEPYQCPGCANQGWAIYEVSRGYPMWESSDEEFGFRQSDAYVDVLGSASGFKCSVCRLELDRREHLAMAGIPLSVDLGTDDATHEEVYEYEQAQIDLYIEWQGEIDRGK